MYKTMWPTFRIIFDHGEYKHDDYSIINDHYQAPDTVKIQCKILKN
jgi:hypothetical protein